MIIYFFYCIVGLHVEKAKSPPSYEKATNLEYLPCYDEFLENDTPQVSERVHLTEIGNNGDQCLDLEDVDSSNSGISHNDLGNECLGKVVFLFILILLQISCSLFLIYLSLCSEGNNFVLKTILSIIIIVTSLLPIFIISCGN